jgi:YhcH/YjgK/YiaL family protein
VIYGNLENLGDITIYPAPIQKAIKYLMDTDLANIEAGVYEIQGRDMYAQIMDIETAFREYKKPEVHRKYIDVQYLVSGKEKIGFAVDTFRNTEIDAYSEEKDILFYEECEGESELLMLPGNFAVFFPNIVHRPGCSYGEEAKIRKVVIKINKEIL